MPPRRKVYLATTEIGEFDFEITAQEGETGAIASGWEDTDLLCGKCHKTLFLALTVDGIFAEFTKIASASAKAHPGFGRRHPVVAVCGDCGTPNRVWPPPIG